MPVIMEGTPPLTGRALPNLINAVKMLKSKSNAAVDVDFDFKILTAFIRLGRAGPDRGRVPFFLLLFDFDFDFDFDFIVF